MTAAAHSIRPIGVKLEVASKTNPSTLRIEVQRELDRVRRSLVLIEERLGELDTAEVGNVTNDDTVVDQRSVPAPSDLYLRLARRGAFPSKKHGKRVVARWGDVRRALLEASPGVQKADARGDERSVREGDELDGLRQRLGLVSKGR